METDTETDLSIKWDSSGPGLGVLPLRITEPETSFVVSPVESGSVQISYSDIKKCVISTKIYIYVYMYITLYLFTGSPLSLHAGLCQASPMTHCNFLLEA